MARELIRRGAKLKNRLGMAVSFAGLLVLLLLPGLSDAQTAAAVPKLDLEKFTGTWYELAHLPNRGEKHCVRDAVTLIAQGDKPRYVQFVKSCMDKAGYIEARNETARPEDKSGDGQMKIRTIWPFSRKYWVLGIGPDYKWALTGSPNHKDLWVLSRTSSLKPDTLAEIEAMATAQGFSLSKLITVQQSASFKEE